MKTEELRSVLLGIINDYPEKACWTVSMEHLKILVDKAVKTEREACARIVEADADARGKGGGGLVLLKAAERIRARGEK